MTNQKRQPSGVPVGGQFDSNSHDEAGGALAVSHDTLMEIGETRDMPVTDIEFGEVTVTRDENDGIEHVSVIVPNDQWGHSRDYDSDEDRVQFLAHYDGVTGSAKRIEPQERSGGWAAAYDYEVTLTNPYTDETITETWGTGSSETHERTPRAADVLHSMVSDAAGVHGRSFDEWCDEMGYEDEEPESDEDYDAINEGTFDPKAKYRKTYDACVEIDTKLQSFLGRRYDDYMWGNYDDSSSLRVTFEKE